MLHVHTGFGTSEQDRSSMQGFDPHLGGCKPGDRSHSLMWEPVSVCSACRIRCSRSKAWWLDPGFFAQALRFFRKALFKDICLFETPSVNHGALLSMRGRRERNRRSLRR
jgi:hypothetical protein